MGGWWARVGHVPGTLCCWNARPRSQRRQLNEQIRNTFLLPALSGTTSSQTTRRHIHFHGRQTSWSTSNLSTHILSCWQHCDTQTYINTHMNESLCRLAASCWALLGTRLLPTANKGAVLQTYFYNPEGPQRGALSNYQLTKEAMWVPTKVKTVLLLQ
jgi:hypothetical protein